MNLFVASLMGIIVVCEEIIVAFSFIFLLLYLFHIFTENFPSLPFVRCFQVNYLSFNPYNEWILATASSDTTIGLLDMRKLSVPLHVLSSHTYALYAPNTPTHTPHPPPPPPPLSPYKSIILSSSMFFHAFVCFS